MNAGHVARAMTVMQDFASEPSSVALTACLTRTLQDDAKIAYWIFLSSIVCEPEGSFPASPAHLSRVCLPQLASRAFRDSSLCFDVRHKYASPACEENITKHFLLPANFLLLSRTVDNVAKLAGLIILLTICTYARDFHGPQEYAPVDARCIPEVCGRFIDEINLIDRLETQQQSPRVQEKVTVCLTLP